jgi:hypothetical protein
VVEDGDETVEEFHEAAATAEESHEEESLMPKPTLGIGHGALRVAHWAARDQRGGSLSTVSE